MSNSPSRHHVQSTVVTQKHSKNPEIEYFWSIKKIVATSWTSAAELATPVKPTLRHRSNRWVSDEPTFGHRCNWTCYTKPSEKNSVAPVKPTGHKEASVHWPWHRSESISSGQEWPGAKSCAQLCQYLFQSHIHIDTNSTYGCLKHFELVQMSVPLKQVWLLIF